MESRRDDASSFRIDLCINNMLKYIKYPIGNKKVKNIIRKETFAAEKQAWVRSLYQRYLRAEPSRCLRAISVSHFAFSRKTGV
jgi:hypothetical protein